MGSSLDCRPGGQLDQHPQLARLMRRFRRATLVVCAGVLLGISVYAGLVKLGLARSLFRPVAGGDLELARSGRSGVRVLFVGNSLTFKNDLPELVHRLAGARTRIFAGSFTAPGWQLSQFAGDRGLERLLRDVHWDVVVLQEQSQIPSFPADDRARSGRRGLGGGATRRPRLDLWARDGTHPSRAGSYLAACVFYALLTRRSPVGNAYTAGLEPAEARLLQRIAWDTAHKRY